MSLEIVSRNRINVYESEDSYSYESEPSYPANQETENVVARTEQQIPAIRSREEQVPTQGEVTHPRQKREFCVLQGCPIDEHRCVTDLWAKFSVCGYECQTGEQEDFFSNVDLIDFDSPVLNYFEHYQNGTLDEVASDIPQALYPTIPVPGTEPNVQRIQRPSSVVVKAGVEDEGDQESYWCSLKLGHIEYEW